MPPDQAASDVTFSASGDLIVASVALASLMGDDATAIGDRVIDEARAAGAAVRVVALDMRRVEMMNSVALGMLVTVQTSLLARKIEFVLLEVPPVIRDLMRSMRLDTVFRFVDTRAGLTTV